MAAIPEKLSCSCPVCDAVIEIIDFDPEIEEPIECPECLCDLDWEFDDETTELKLIEPDEDDDGDNEEDTGIDAEFIEDDDGDDDEND